MNRKAFFATLLTIIAITADAQQRFFVKDSLTQDPVAFTSVWFGNDTGGYTNESGMIVIPEGTKQIRLSHICYETKVYQSLTAVEIRYYSSPRALISKMSALVLSLLKK